jgi:hypothetical protein
MKEDQMPEKLFVSDDKKLIAKKAWMAFLKSPQFPELEQQLKEAELPEVLPIVWRSGFRCCLIAMENGALGPICAPTDPANN